MRYSTLAFTAAAALLAAVPMARAEVISGSVTAWDSLTPGQNINSPDQQALPGNPLMTSGHEAVSFSFSGGLPDFAEQPQSGNILGNFVGAFPGATGTTYHNGWSSSSVLSQGNFAQATIAEIVFTTTESVSGVINHDDGVSLFDSGMTNPLDDLVSLSAASPTSLAQTDFSIGAGTYDLYYVEANGAPADLYFTDVQIAEPGSLALVASGLLGLTMAGWRRRRS